VAELRVERGRLDEVFRQLTRGESGPEKPAPEPAAAGGKEA
jgi:hypothetical protein